MLKQRPKTAKLQAEISPYRFKMADHERGRERKKGAHVWTMQGVQLPSQVLPIRFTKSTWRMRMVKYKEYHRR